MEREHRAREQGTHQLSAATAQDVTTELFVLLRCVRETRRHGEEAVAFCVCVCGVLELYLESCLESRVTRRVDECSPRGDAVTHYPGSGTSRSQGLAQGSERATLALLLAVHTKL